MTGGGVEDEVGDIGLEGSALEGTVSHGQPTSRAPAWLLTSPLGR